MRNKKSSACIINPDENEVDLWTMQDVCVWLDTKGFSAFIPEFSRHKVDGVALMLLTEEDLKKDLGIELLGDVKRVFSAISKLRMKNLENEKLSSTSFSYLSNATSSFTQKHKSSLSHSPNNLCPPQNISKRIRTYSSDSQAESADGHYIGGDIGKEGRSWAYNSLNPSRGPTNFPPEYFRTVVSGLYMFLVTWVTAIVMVYVHDRVPDKERHPPLPDIFLDNVPHISWAFQLCEITILILVITWIVILFFHKHRSILLRRFSALSGSVFLLRCATMFITSLSVPGHHQECSPRDESDLWHKLHQASIIWKGGGLSIKGVRTCGDYMFSGHTTALTILNFFITEYTPRRMYFLHIASWVLNTFGIFFILAAHEHYSIDVFIAFYITSRMFLYYHSLANNRALQQRDSFRTKIWFPMFSYFEAHIDGIVPNEYSNPLAKENVSWFLKGLVLLPSTFIGDLFSSPTLSPIVNKKGL